MRRIRRPHLVAMAMPITASTTAMATSTLLSLGILKLLVSLCPAHATNTKSSTMWTIAPATTLSPMPVTPAAGSIPAFCRNRRFSAMPPTFAGVTRFTKDDAICASTLGNEGELLRQHLRPIRSRRRRRSASDMRMHTISQRPIGVSQRVEAVVDVGELREQHVERAGQGRDHDERARHARARDARAARAPHP